MDDRLEELIQMVKNGGNIEMEREVIDVTLGGLLYPFKPDNYRKFKPGMSHYFINYKDGRHEMTKEEYDAVFARVNQGEER